MQKPKYITAVVYEIDAQTEKGRFTIPVEVRNALEIAKEEYPPLYLVIHDAISDELLFEGHQNMTSGPEILGPETRASIESKQRIRVTVSRMD